MRARPSVRGFTLIELMIVVAILGILASIAVPGLLSSRLAANEAGAISTMRSLVTAQSQFRTVLAIDADQDGAGEYGTFGELSGAVLLNARGVGPASPLDPPIMGPPFEQVDALGNARKSGYFFKIYLPDVANVGVAEAGGGGPQPGINPDNAEYAWSCYAWPVETRITGNRTFFVDQRGEILETRMDAAIYSGVANPAFDAALTGPSMAATPAIGIPGTDGNRWVPLQ